MKKTLWALLGLLVVLLPSACADPEATGQTGRASLVDGGIFVEENVNFESSSFEPAAHFWVPATAYGLGVEYLPPQGPRVAVVNVSRESTQGNFVLYRAELGATAPVGGQAYGISVTYKAPGKSVELRTYYASPGLRVWASTQPGSRATVSPFAVSDVGGGVMHGGQAPVAANYTYQVAYEAGPTTATGTDVSKYVWAVGGLVAGALLVWLAARRGSGGKKFVKGGAMESRTMLEARRRTLLAALKDLEQAHESKEVPDDAYAPLKEEYKAQAVRVMRNLEEKKESS